MLKQNAQLSQTLTALGLDPLKDFDSLTVASSGVASTDPALPGGTSCYADSGGPAFAYENTADNLVVEGIISYGSEHSCEYSRSYLVLAANNAEMRAGSA